MTLASWEFSRERLKAERRVLNILNIKIAHHMHTAVKIRKEQSGRCLIMFTLKQRGKFPPPYSGGLIISSNEQPKAF